jgi:hypothetical protein
VDLKPPYLTEEEDWCPWVVDGQVNLDVLADCCHYIDQRMLEREERRARFKALGLRLIRGGKS